MVFTSITEEPAYQVGQRALIQAMQISAMPELVDAVEKHDLPRIKELIDPMRSFPTPPISPSVTRKVGACIT